MTKSFVVVAALAFIVALSSAFTKISDPAWKNLKVLPQNTTEQQMDSVMHHFSSALNVGCEFCHVKTMNGSNEEWDMASDKRKHKLKAREMMLMTNEINNKYFPYGGKAEDLSTALTVTCYSCHNGHKEPLVKEPAKPESADGAKSN
ncbi:MAG: c-type cytochrome [Chitinophagaceae bacterium]|nr:MAG: c-type cytochrome [Chitinophagaceae bacterium]